MKKFISLLMVMALILSFAAPVLAEEEPVENQKSEDVMESEEEVTEDVDETPASPQLAAGLNLAEIGIVDGYADGELGLEDTITRAQIAVLVAKCSGMADEADALKAEPSKFSDVKADEWYTGWVNLAAEKGWISGDPAGTFRPNDPVQYREAITILIQALGYTSENLDGEWPENFIAKAAELGLTEELDFQEKDAAPRGDIFVMVDGALDYDTLIFSESLVYVGEAEDPADADTEVDPEDPALVEPDEDADLDNEVFATLEEILTPDAIQIFDEVGGQTYSLSMSDTEMVMASGSLVKGHNDLSSVLAEQDLELTEGTYFLDILDADGSLLLRYILHITD